jgi:hypothetical protein
VQGKYGDGRSCGNNVRDLVDGLPDALRRFKAKAGTETVEALAA